MKAWIASDVSVYEMFVFQEVAETKSISRAAERLGITQPGLSRLVKKLEDQFGVSLLIRTKHGVELTKSGEKFVVESRALLRQFESLRDSIQRQFKQVEGTYSLGAHPQVAAVTFPRVFQKLLSENEKLELRPAYDLSRRIVESVISYRVDFGIVVDPIQHPDLTLVPLYQDVMRFWVSQGPHLTSLVYADLNLKQSDQVIAVAYREGRLTKERIIHSSDLQVVRELTAFGAGIGVLTASVVTHLGANRFVPLEDWPECIEKIYLVYRKDAQKSRASRLIRDHIVACLKGLPVTP